MSSVLTESLTVPESYQPLALICFGVWGWIAVLYVSDWQRINVNALLHTTSNHQKRPLVTMATTLSALLICHIALLEHTLFRQHTNIFNHFGPVVLCYAIATALALYFQDGQRFFKCLCRLFRNCPVYFSDVLVADILVSFSGVFTGMCVKLMQVGNMPYSRYAPFVTSIPYMIRLKQCLCDYYAQKYLQKSKLVNALKYASSIPVIFLAHKTKLDGNANSITSFSDTNQDFVWHIWFFSAIFSNIFAFGWDLVMDWGLIQAETDTLTIRLRKDMYFSEPHYYIAAVGINATLRLLKTGSHMYHIHPVCVDLAEIVRRWIWVVFRLENEWIKRSYSMTDIELQHQHRGDVTRPVYAEAGNVLQIMPLS